MTFRVTIGKGYTRLPVFDGKSVVDLLHTKEFLKFHLFLHTIDFDTKRSGHIN